jgi:hypothetical protein
MVCSASASNSLHPQPHPRASTETHSTSCARRCRLCNRAVSVACAATATRTLSGPPPPHGPDQDDMWPRSVCWCSTPRVCINAHTRNSLWPARRERARQQTPRTHPPALLHRQTQPKQASANKGAAAAHAAGQQTHAASEPTHSNTAHRTLCVRCTCGPCATATQAHNRAQHALIQGRRSMQHAPPTRVLARRVPKHPRPLARAPHTVVRHEMARALHAGGGTCSTGVMDAGRQHAAARALTVCAARRRGLVVMCVYAKHCPPHASMQHARPPDHKGGQRRAAHESA